MRHFVNGRTRGFRKRPTTSRILVIFHLLTPDFRLHGAAAARPSMRKLQQRHEPDDK